MMYLSFDIYIVWGPSPAAATNSLLIQVLTPNCPSDKLQLAIMAYAPVTLFQEVHTPLALDPTYLYIMPPLANLPK